MQKPLDPLSFKKNRYERPNQDWICGRAREGYACPLGPDERGNCRATGQCNPAKRGDRWFCNRAEADGGKCAEGPLPNGGCAHPIPPCQPIRSLRRLRGTIVWLVIALTTGALLLLFGKTFRKSWIEPGELATAHATSAAKCSDCHSLESNAHPPIARISFPEKRALADSALCLKCHVLGDQPLKPHGLTSDALAAIDRKIKGTGSATRGPALLRLSRSLSSISSHSGEVACLTCHQEHHGHEFDLKHLSNAQCQSCHSAQFKSFENGHAEFTRYPYRRRTRIFFDHSSHLQQHFASMKDKAPGSCQDCHTPEASGRLMQVKNFDTSCAACHAPQIAGDGMSVKGVPFFTVPGLDVDTLAGKGITVGEWPKLAEGKITPFMELLLGRQPATREAMQELRGIDLLDLGKATPEQIAAAEQLAWGVKSLLFHLVVEGQAYLVEQLKDEISAAGLSIPRSTLLLAQKDWMPRLLTEVSDYRNGIKPTLPEVPKPPEAPPSTPQTKPSSDDDLLGGEDLAPPPSATSATPGGNDLLTGGDDDLAPATASPTPVPTAAAQNEDLTSGDLLEPGGANQAPAGPAATATTPPALENKSAQEWVTAGGWYVPQDGFTLFYRPSGHADSFLVAWLTAAAKWQGKTAAPWTRDAFQTLADPQTPGRCMKCHTVETSGDATIVNWRPALPQPQDHPFTTFRHTTHFSLLGDTGCQTCHTLNPKSGYAKYFTGQSVASANRDPAHFESNFHALSKATCITCHTPKIAGDDCLLCHRYHTGTFAEKLVGDGQISSAAHGKK